MFFIFKRAQKLDYHFDDIDFQKRVVIENFRGEKWETEEFLKRLDSATDFYFDSVSQIQMNSWSKGRVALLGDAAFCPSLLSGQGAALAMAGAYVLAGELYQAEGDYFEGFKNFEIFFMDFVEKKQKTADSFVQSFVPSSSFKIWLRNQAGKLMNILFISRLYWKRFLVDPIYLKDYNTFNE